MNVKVLYKSLTIDLEISNIPIKLKIENLKTGLKNSLSSYRDDNEKVINKVSTPVKTSSQNKKDKDQNFTIAHLSFSSGKNDENKLDAKEINELLDSKYYFKLFTFDEIPCELTDKEYIQTDKKGTLKLLLTRNLRIERPKPSIYSDKPENLIMEITEAKNALKPIETTKKSAFNDLLSGRSHEDIISALLDMNQDGLMLNDGRNRLLSRFIQLANSNQVVSNNSNSSVVLNSNSMPQPPPFQPNQDLINQLVEMGFDETRAKNALTRTRNNLEAAVEMIANDEDLGFEDSQVYNQNYQSNISNQEDEELDVEYYEEN